MYTISVEPCATAREIAEMLNVTPTYVRQIAARGGFGDAAFKVGGTTWRFKAKRIMEMYGIEAVSEGLDHRVRRQGAASPAKGGKVPE